VRSVDISGDFNMSGSYRNGSFVPEDHESVAATPASRPSWSASVTGSGRRSVSNAGGLDVAAVQSALTQFTGDMNNVKVTMNATIDSLNATNANLAIMLQNQQTFINEIKDLRVATQDLRNRLPRCESQVGTNFQTIHGICVALANHHINPMPVVTEFEDRPFPPTPAIIAGPRVVPMPRTPEA